jgi:hypothetical protein
MDTPVAFNKVGGAAPTVSNLALRAGAARPLATPAKRFGDSLPVDDTTGETTQDAPRATEPLAPAPLSEAARQRTIEEMRTLLRAMGAGESDPETLTDLIFYARHPELIGADLTGDHQSLDEWNLLSSFLVHPLLDELRESLGPGALSMANGAAGPNLDGSLERLGDTADMTPLTAAQRGAGEHFDEVIARAVAACPGLSPALLKSLLIQESDLRPHVINQYGYAGIAQFGRDEAREVGLQVGLAGSHSDERLNPHKAIPAAARLLDKKAQRLGEMAFSRYGQPSGAEFWRFVMAAYNGGEGTVALAMGHAYRQGVARARARGLLGPEVIDFARQYASSWQNLTAGGLRSPLGQAVARHFPALAATKYQEISNYSTAVVARSLPGSDL